MSLSRLQKCAIVTISLIGMFAVVGFQSKRDILAELLLTQARGPVYLGDGLTAEKILLCSPMGLAWHPQGDLLISDRGSGLGRVIWRIDRHGVGHIFAGSLKKDLPSIGPAREVSFQRPDSMAVSANGDIFVVDGFSHSVYRLDQNHIVSRVAGIGRPGFSGDGGPASEAALSRPADITFDTAGNLFIADVDNHRIRRIDVNGDITTIAGTGIAGFSPDGTLARDAQLNSPWGIAVDFKNRLLIADSENHRVRRVQENGRLITLAGNGERGFSGDGGPAVAARLDSPQALFFDYTKGLYVVDEHNHTVRLVTNDNKIKSVVGTGKAGVGVLGTTAANSSALNDPESILISPTGDLIVADGNNGRIVRVTSDGITSHLAGSGDIDRCKPLKHQFLSLLGRVGD